MIQTVTSSRFRTFGVLLVILVLGAVAAIRLLQARSLASRARELTAQVAAGPHVRTLVVRAAGEDQPLTFQGEVLPIATATLYGKLGGFVKEVRVDKGSQVRKGEVLAVLESPETDRQTVALRVSYENAQRTADRLVQLGKQGIANAQDVDTAVAAARVAREQLAAQEVTQGYEQVVAPFSGVITARLVDVGAFIQNATGSLSSQPILSLADRSRLRVDFFLDQASAARAKVGQSVDVHPADRPDLVRTVPIARLAGALDLRTRTLLAEAELDNRDGAFLPGGYVNVALHLPRGAGAIQIPSEALLMQGSEAFAVAVIAGKAHLQPLVLGDDSGEDVQVVRGLRSGDRIIRNPPPGLQEGDTVQVE